MKTRARTFIEKMIDFHEFHQPLLIFIADRYKKQAIFLGQVLALLTVLTRHKWGGDRLLIKVDKQISQVTSLTSSTSC